MNKLWFKVANLNQSILINKSICILLQETLKKNAYKSKVGKHTPCKYWFKKNWIVYINIEVDFWRRIIVSGKERHFTMIKRINSSKNITILNVYVFNNRASRHIKENMKLRKNEEKNLYNILRCQNCFH